MVEYSYDAWGKPLTKTGTLATTLGTLNPFRYRGYVYDEETGLYYLRSRYYNPDWGRFVNADSVLGKPGQLLGHNVFEYCTNSPISYYDKNGHEPENVSFWMKIIDNVTNTVSTKGAEAQLIFNLIAVKRALNDISKKQDYYLFNYPYTGADMAFQLDVTGKYAWYISQVNHNAPMDYKSPGRAPWWTMGRDLFVFRGELINLEMYGNINYGFVGAALGIPDEVIFLGGGYAAFTGNGDKSNRIDYYFDSEEDHDNVAWGISIYKTICVK